MTFATKSSGTPMVSVFANAATAEIELARYIAKQISCKPNSVLGLATGNSMIAVYRSLVEMHTHEGLSFAQTSSYNLDEYCGLPEGHPARFATYMRNHFFSMVDMMAGNAHLPNAEGCDTYEAAIAQTGIDLQVLGIGRNGHIGFNEPGADIASRTRVVELAASTRAANQRDFPENETVPTHAVTMGLATILSAERIILLATGDAKAKALAGALNGAIGPDNPASFLRLHPRVEIFCDDAAVHLEMGETKTNYA